MGLTLQVAACAILVLAAISDIRHLRIPNRYSLILIGLFVGLAFTLPLPETGIRVLVAQAVLFVGFLGFGAGLFGGGDVKILSAYMLFVPFDRLNLFALMFSGGLLLGIAGFLATRKIAGDRLAHLAAFDEKAGYPMGLSIAMAGVGLTYVITLA